MLRLTVPLDEQERQALLALSQKERRDPRQQAAKIICDFLREQGYLTRVEKSDRRAVVHPMADAIYGAPSSAEGGHS